MRASSAPRPTSTTRAYAVLLALALVLGLVGTLPATQQADAAACPCTVFPASTVPTTQVDPDTKAVELGLKFQANQPGAVTGVRFWKSSVNVGTHTGALWDRAGTRLASVTFTNETASGWQQANFATPVQVTANTTYIVSYYAPKGRYAADEDYFATSSVTNGPLTALQNGTDGGQSVYRYGTGGGFPRSTYKSSNYYVDAVFLPTNNDTTKPTVSDQLPLPGATGVARNSSVKATFSEPVDPATIVMTLSAGSTPVPASTSYDAATRVVTLRPNGVLANTTAYTVNLSGAKDTSDNQNQMVPVTWGFTSNSDPGNCPCSVYANTVVPPVEAATDDSAIELGVRFRASVAGFVTGVRFYKGTGNGGTHVGSLWSNTGTKLASVTFSGETATGWQTATFGAPVAVAANTTYVASYFAPVGRYAAANDAFVTSSTQNGVLTLLANGTDGPNGVYRYGASSFPTDMYRQTNYFVDVVFDTSANDSLPPTVVTKVPGDGSSGAAVSGPVKAVFSEPVVAGTAAVELKKADGSVVAGTTTYDAPSQTVTFTPSAALAVSSAYTVKVSGAKDPAGNTMSAVTWGFSTGAAPPPPPDQGPGGPIAVVTSAAKPYSKFYAEILRTEGLNEFTTIDVSTLSASTLAAYDVVVLGEVGVSDDQANALSSWVSAGGNLIAMRPGANLAGLLGLTPGSGSVGEGYLKVDPATAPGAGIVSETMQFHGAADRYTAAGGTQTVAALYTDATTSASAPAVTLRNVGSNGGQAAAFTYDLARSVALTRQGNPAWAGTERDGLDPIRSDDMFFGGNQTNWIDFAKVAIPQADEQQRLLANLIQVTNRDRKPLPRFWYFPNSQKAVIVATGDDHGNNGTTGRFNQWAANSPANCSVADWTCLRYSSYLYNNTPLSAAAATDYTNQGFEVGLHANTYCGNYTPTSIADTYASQMSVFRSTYPGLVNPTSTRAHCIVFSDWASQPKVELAQGMRMDTNYYYWPDSFVQNRPGFMTGSGMAMRFTDVDGTMIDNYQAATQMTDESGQSFPYTVDALLDGALGSTGYYGAFVANMHTDLATEPGSDALLASAKSHGNVPIVSGRQLTTWLDGRNASSYGNVGWSGNKLTFTVAVGTGANNLTSMVPTAGPNGTQLTGIVQGTTTVTYARSTIKGLEYATFNPGPGTYTATYAAAGTLTAKSAKVSTSQVTPKLTNKTDDAGGTVQTAPSAATTSQNATVSWRTSSPATSQVLVGTSPGALKPVATQADSTSEHQVSVRGLEPGTTYYYRVASTDGSDDAVTSPATSEAPATFTTAAADVTAPVASEVDVTPQPDGTAKVTWLTNELSAGAVKVSQPGTNEKDVQVSRKLTLDHTFVLDGLEPGSTYLVKIISQDAVGNRSISKAARLITPAEGVAQQTAAAFRTGKVSGDAVVDDAGTGSITLGGKTGVNRSGTFTSNVLDAGQMVDWDRATFSVKLPTSSTAALWVRTGSTLKQDGWTGWTKITGPKFRVDASSRYVQYRIDLTAPVGIAAPGIYGIGFSNNAAPVVAPHE